MPTPQEEQPCPHCDAPVHPADALAPYCCTGCRGAHRFLTGEGLGRYYTLRDALGASNGPAPTGQSPAELAWLAPLLEKAPSCDGIVRLNLDVQGLRCGACVWLLQQLFQRMPGAVQIEINPGLGQMLLIYQEGSFALEAYLNEARALGYRAGPPHERKEEGDDLIVRLGVCAAIAMNGMIFSFANYFGLTAQSDAGLYALFGWANLGLSALSMLVGGSVFIKGAARAAAAGLLHLDVPIALGILVAFTGSAWSFVAASGQATYFDTLQIFITLMLLGRLIQRRVISRNRRMLLRDDGVGGLVVRQLSPSGQVQVRPAAEIEAGLTLIIAPAEVVPVEALLQGDDAELALDWLNGEPEPRMFRSGDTLPAGARNCGQRALSIVATQPFSASHLRELLTSTRDIGDRPHWGRFWDRVSRGYVLIVLSMAALGAAIWWPTSPERAVEVVVAVLVVTCPCALGLATPLAYDLVQSRLRQRGMFVRRLSFLDRALSIKKVVFDKTGTLTLGELQLQNPTALDTLDDQTRAALAHMVARSNHPRSRALFERLQGPVAGGPSPLLPVEELAGRGILTRWGGFTWRLGSAPFALDAADVPNDTAQAGPSVSDAADGETLFTRQGQEIARFCFQETLRADARAEVLALQDRGVQVFLLSGDEHTRVCDIAQTLGVPAHHVRAGASPEQKAEFVRSINLNDTLMIGDGINDALAFDAAYCSGTPAVDRTTLPSRSDFFYLGNGVGPISDALDLAQQVRQRIHRNLMLAAGYNFITIFLALTGHMSPLLCAIAMPLSSVGIVFATGHALRRAPTGSSARPPQRQSHTPRVGRPLEGLG